MPKVDRMGPETTTAALAAAGIDLPPGHLISGRYRVIRKLGSGGMGTVFLVEHTSIQKLFALKALQPDLAKHTDLAARFLQEARLASRIGHENVVNITDSGETVDGLVYFIMEYLDGLDLDAVVRANGPLPWSRVRPIMLQVVAALHAAHKQGIIHRDVKPANVLLCNQMGRTDFVKVLDFGIAKVVDSAQANDVVTNRSVEILGTPAYMAPEQGQSKDIDCRTDVYACGCLLYHLLTGRPPFRGHGHFGVLMKQVLEIAPPPSTHLPAGSLPPHVDAIVLKALAKKPERRWQTMQELAAAIEADERLDLDLLRRSSSSVVVDGSRITEPHDSLPAGGPSAATAGIRSVVGRGRSRPLLIGALLLAVMALILLVGRSDGPHWRPRTGPERSQARAAPWDAAPELSQTRARLDAHPSQGLEVQPGSQPTGVRGAPAEPTKQEAHMEGSPKAGRPDRPARTRRLPMGPSGKTRFEPLADPAVE